MLQLARRIFFSTSPFARGVTMLRLARRIFFLTSPGACSQAISITTMAKPQLQELHALLFTISVWVLLRPLLTITLKMQETGPTVYSLYPRRPERLTISRYNYKGSMFSSVILRPSTFCTAVRHSTN